MKKYLIILVFFLAVTILGVRYISAADERMLILNSTSGTCNIYAKPDGKQALTYISPAYGRDVPLIDQSGQWYKIMISGVEGWIKKGDGCFGGANSLEKKVSTVSSRSISNDGVSLTGLNVTRYHVIGNKMYLNIIYGANYVPLQIGYTEVPSGLKNNTVYYSYDGNYFYTNYNTMVGDYRNNNRNNAANKNKPFYNYYQYLPIRSTSKIGGANLDKRLTQVRTDADIPFKETKTLYQSCNNTKKFVSEYNYYISAVYKKGNIFINKQSTSQVNAGALYGIMLNESGYGTSELSRHYNNPFGWGAVDSCPKSATRYKSMDDAIVQYYANMSSSYANPADWRGGNGTQLGNKKAGANVKYASDPYWGYKNAFNYRKLDELAGNVDKNRYKLGIINSGSKAVDGIISNEYTKVYSSASTSSSVPYYYERNGSSVIIEGESGSFYKIQKDSAPNAGSVYILKSKVDVVSGNTGSGGTSTPEPTGGNNKYIQYNEMKTYKAKSVLNVRTAPSINASILSSKKSFAKNETFTTFGYVDNGGYRWHHVLWNGGTIVGYVAEAPLDVALKGRDVAEKDFYTSDITQAGSQKFHAFKSAVTFKIKENSVPLKKHYSNTAASTSHKPLYFKDETFKSDGYVDANGYRWLKITWDNGKDINWLAEAELKYAEMGRLKAESYFTVSVIDGLSDYNSSTSTSTPSGGNNKYMQYSEMKTYQAKTVLSVRTAPSINSSILNSKKSFERDETFSTFGYVDNDGYRWHYVMWNGGTTIGYVAEAPLDVALKGRDVAEEDFYTKDISKPGSQKFHAFKSAVTFKIKENSVPLKKHYSNTAASTSHKPLYFKDETFKSDGYVDANGYRWLKITWDNGKDINWLTEAELKYAQIGRDKAESYYTVAVIDGHDSYGGPTSGESGSGESGSGESSSGGSTETTPPTSITNKYIQYNEMKTYKAKTVLNVRTSPSTSSSLLSSKKSFAKDETFSTFGYVDNAGYRWHYVMWNGGTTIGYVAEAPLDVALKGRNAAEKDFFTADITKPGSLKFTAFKSPVTFKIKSDSLPLKKHYSNTAVSASHKPLFYKGETFKSDGYVDVNGYRWLKVTWDNGKNINWLAEAELKYAEMGRDKAEAYFKVSIIDGKENYGRLFSEESTSVESSSEESSSEGI